MSEEKMFMASGRVENGGVSFILQMVMGIYCPFIWGFLIRIPIKQSGFHGMSAKGF